MKFSLACAYSSVLYADFDRTRGFYTQGPSLDELIEQINRAHQLGYTGVELETLTRTQLHDVFTKQNVARLKEVCESLAMDVPGFYTAVHPPRERNNASVQGFRGHLSSVLSARCEVCNGSFSST